MIKDIRRNVRGEKRQTKERVTKYLSINDKKKRKEEKKRKTEEKENKE